MIGGKSQSKNVVLRAKYKVSYDFLEVQLFLFHRISSKWHFLSAPFYFIKHCGRMRGMKVSVIGEGA
jgi:hypothetical protein